MSVLQQQTFSDPGAFQFNVPNNVSAVFVTLVAGGSGGGGAAGFNKSQQSAGGGGGGESFYRRLYAVTPGGTVDGVIGAGGAGGPTGVDPSNPAIPGYTANDGGVGGDTSFGTMVVKGGRAGGGVHSTLGSGTNGSAGGGYAAIILSGTGAPAVRESVRYWSGGQGGLGGPPDNTPATTAPSFEFAAQAPNWPGGPGGTYGPLRIDPGASPGGGGGASTPYGQGGGGAIQNPIAFTLNSGGLSPAANAYGAGGGGGGNTQGSSFFTIGSTRGATGANGVAIIEWIGR